MNMYMNKFWSLYFNRNLCTCNRELSLGNKPRWMLCLIWHQTGRQYLLYYGPASPTNTLVFLRYDQTLLIINFICVTVNWLETLLSKTCKIYMKLWHCLYFQVYLLKSVCIYFNTQVSFLKYEHLLFNKPINVNVLLTKLIGSPDNW